MSREGAVFFLFLFTRTAFFDLFLLFYFPVYILFVSVSKQQLTC
jgi:hypothetical protein